jgi:hypothetical protein
MGYMQITNQTRVIAQNDTSFLLTNDNEITYQTFDRKDMGCIANPKYRFVSPELPLIVLTKEPGWGPQNDKLNVEEVINYERIG